MTGHTSPQSVATQRAVIGVDVGTTAAKVTAFFLNPTANSRRVAASREYPLEQPQPGWQVQDPHLVVEATLEALTECVAQLGGAPVLAIGLSTAMHGLIGLDADRRPITPLVTWADSRATPQAAALKRDRVASAQRSGTPTHPMAPIAKIRWFVDEDPAAATRVRWWIGLKDWLIYHLTDELVTELSCASGTGMLSLSTLDWDPELVALAGIGVDQLPPVLATTHQLPLSPEVAQRVGLPVSLPVVVGAGDGPLGNLGVGALGPGVAALSLGTSGGLRVMVERPPALNDGSLFCYALTHHAWALGGAISNGGVVARWAGETFLPAANSGPRDDELLGLAASVPAGCEGLVMIPYLMGERAPLWDPAPAGAYLGIRRHHTRAHFARAAIEGVAMSLASVLDHLDAVTPISEIRATGGVFRSSLWREIVAACLNRRFVVTDAAAGSGLGAAALALTAVGVEASLSSALAALGVDAVPVEAELPPADLVELYRRQRASIESLVASLTPIAQALSPER